VVSFEYNFLICLDSASTGLGIIYAGRIIVGLAIGAASNLAVSVICHCEKNMQHLTSHPAAYLRC
jgi:hypothetical protein